MPFQKGHKRIGGIKTGQKTKKTIEQEMALEFLRKKIRDDWEDLINSKINLAKGLWVEKTITTPMGKQLVKVYKKEPHSETLEYLFSIVVGRPKEQLDMNLSWKRKKLQDIQDKMNFVIDLVHDEAKKK